MSLKLVKAFLKLLKRALKRPKEEGTINMATPVTLRVCGVEFDRIELRKSTDRFSKMLVEVNDSKFGTFTLDPAMKLEIREGGRWKMIPLESFISHLLLAKMC
jgi:hypothetical protein